jgi:hypothetical protein
MGRGGSIIGAIAEILGAIAEEQIIEEGLEEAIETMRGMGLNKGQESILEDRIIPDFEFRASVVPAGEDWPNVSAYPYQDFMSETVEAGNSIMTAAYRAAKVADFISDWGDNQNQSSGFGGIIDVVEDGIEAANQSVAATRF